jgi:hypothetical protein
MKHLTVTFPQSPCRPFSSPLLTYLTYLLDLLTLWCKILFEKLIVTQLIKNILLRPQVADGGVTSRCGG